VENVKLGPNRPLPVLTVVGAAKPELDPDRAVPLKVISEAMVMEEAPLV